ncbi:unnamed protein product [Ectocarpus sp. 13 AM-2016]
MALRLSSKTLRPWVPLEESKRLLAEALPLVGALEAPSEAVQSDRGFVSSVPPEGPASERLEVTVDASLLLLRLSGRFSAAEASAGDGLALRVALMSLLPLDTRLEAIEARTLSSGRGGLAFNHSALNCTIRDTQSTGPAGATPAAGNHDPPSSSSCLDQQQHSADLTLRAGGLLTVNVGLCLPWSALPSSEPLRLVEARVLLTKRGGGDVAAAAAAAASGVTLLVPSGPGSDIAREGGEAGSWARAPGFEAVRLVPPRARAHVRIAEPSSVLLDLTTRLLVTVSKAPVATAAAGATAKSSERSGGGSGYCGRPPHPFRGGFLHLECEPAPVPPPIVSPHSAPTAAVGGGSSSQDQQQSSAAPPPARPRPERAFFWAPATMAARTGDEDPSVTVSDGKGGFLPVVVGSDGQPLEGIPLPLSSLDPSRDEEEEEGKEQVQEVTVPVWVRSETAGKVAVRARVVYGLGGKSPGAAGAAAAGGGGGEAAEGVAVTEWARAEVLCVRPLAMAVDVVSVPADEGRRIRGGGGNGATATAAAAAAPWACERSGHTVAVKVSLTNLQEKRLVVSRMEVVPPLASSSSSSTTAATASPASATTAAAAATPAASSDGGAEGTVTWATLPNGPVLHDDDAATAARAASGGSGAGVVALPGTGDTYTCCFAAKGEAERPAPLGKLRVTWRPDETGGGDGTTTSPATGGGEAAVGGVTEFPLPVLTARPPALSARLKAPPHARVGVEFSMSWEISNLTAVYSAMQLTTEDGGDFVWSGKRLCMLQVAPMETVSVVYRLVPIVPGHVLLPKVAVVPEREQINIIPDLADGRPHIFVRP